MANRVRYYDSIAGILILYMIAQHVMLSCHLQQESVFIWLGRIFCFFMPWFFFKAGMFFHKTRWREMLQKSCKRLLIPFAIYSLIGLIVERGIAYLEGDHDWTNYVIYPIKEVFLKGSITGNLPLWFLTTLFAVRILFWLLDHAKIHPLIIVLFGFILGFVAYKMCPKVLYLRNIPMALSFYSLGTYLVDKQSESVRSITNNYIIFATAVIYLTCIILAPSVVDFRQNEVNEGSWFIWIICSSAGIILFNGLFEKFDIHIFSQIGKDSMFYYCAHYPLLTAFSYIATRKFGIGGGWLSFAIIYIAIIIILILIRHYVPKFSFGIKRG